MPTKTTIHPIVGTVTWTTTKFESGNSIQIPSDLEAQITVVHVPQLVGVLDARTEAFEKAGKKFDGNVKFFKPVQPQLLAAFAEIAKEGLQSRLVTWDGSFVPRLQKRKGGGFVQSPSNHAFGTAIDINAGFNGQGDKPAAIGKKGSVRELVPIFEKHGFLWGGLFGGTSVDGMHFEVTKILKEERVTVPIAVTVKINGQVVAVPAMLIEDTTWVGVRAMIALLDDQDNNTTDAVTSFGGNQLKAKVVVNGIDHELDGLLLGSTGFVPFRQIQPLYSVPFKFTNGPSPVLDLTLSN